MSLWKIFEKEVNDSQSELFRKVKILLPNSTEDEWAKFSCIAGLLCRVAYVDFHYDPKELESLREILMKWSGLEDSMVERIAQFAVENVKDLAGLENHLYVQPLRELMGKEEKFNLIRSLFALAKSDGVVENVESEEIRIICKGLDLSTQHFIAARAEVASKLGALKL